MEDQHPITHLLFRFVEGNLSDEERKELDQWVSDSADRQMLLDSLANGDQLIEDIKLWGDLWGKSSAAKEKLLRRRVHRTISSKLRVRRWIRWSGAAAAILLFAFLAGKQLMVSETADLNTSASNIFEEILPGGHKAYLHLGNQNTIALSEHQTGVIWDGTRLRYEDGSVIWSEVSGDSDKSAEILTLVTPRGGIYQITLPDSTRVWLNAASTLKYPTHFDSDKRIVQLEGEGYFEVAPDPLRHFVVESTQQVIEVLGTAFNIQAYAQEAQTRTTLLHGKIRVWANDSVVAPDNRRKYVLAPGQQAISRSGQIERITVDPESSATWRKGILILDETELSSVLRHISRWYDVEIDSSNVQLGSHVLYGRLDANLPLSNLLSGLEMNTKFSYTINERRVIVNK